MSIGVVRIATLPDEFSQGYAGRLARVNGFESIQALEAQLKVCFGSTPGTRRTSGSMAELLAAVADMPVKAYLQAHSMLVIWSIQSECTQCDSAESSQSYRLMKHGASSGRSEMYYCAACAQADVAFHGVSYWRREHQIPGTYGCSKHGRPLYFAAHSRIDASPLSLRGKSKRVPHGLFEKSMGSAAVLRHQEFVHGLMQMGVSSSIEKVYQLVRPYLARAGIEHYSYSGAKKHLLDLIVASYPLAWLNASFSQKNALHNLMFDARSRSLGVAPSPWPIWVLTLATAAVVKSSDEALNVWAGNFLNSGRGDSVLIGDLMPEASEKLIQSVQNFCSRRKSDEHELAFQVDAPEELMGLLRSLASQWLAQRQVASESKTSQTTALGGQL